MKKIISEKEYANICLECPYKLCHGTYTGCERTRKYRTNNYIHNERLKDEERIKNNGKK